MLPICFTHGLALLSHYFKSSTCVCSVIFSLQRRCMGVLCCYFRPKMFSPGDDVRYHSRTLGAHVLATVGINAKVASHVFSLLASVEGTTVCLEIPLQSRPPPPPPGDRHALTWEFARGAGGTSTRNQYSGTIARGGGWGDCPSPLTHIPGGRRTHAAAIWQRPRERCCVVVWICPLAHLCGCTYLRL